MADMVVTIQYLGYHAHRQRKQTCFLSTWKTDLSDQEQVMRRERH